MFRSGVANEEFDGLARYSELKMAVGNLGGTARSSRPMFGMGLIFLVESNFSYGNLGGTARKESSSQWDELSYFYYVRRFYYAKSL